MWVCSSSVRSFSFRFFVLLVKPFSLSSNSLVFLSWWRFVSSRWFSEIDFKPWCSAWRCICWYIHHVCFFSEHSPHDRHYFCLLIQRVLVHLEVCETRTECSSWNVLGLKMKQLLSSSAPSSSQILSLASMTSSASSLTSKFLNGSSDTRCTLVHFRVAKRFQMSSRSCSENVLMSWWV